MKARKAPARGRDTTGELLFEIGTEELPYQFVRPALATLDGAAQRLLKEQRLAYRAVRTLATPRRLVLVVEGLAAHQEPAVTEVMGPPKTAAFDAGGAPTRAATGFAAGQQVAVDALEVRQTPRGEYVFAVKRDPGRPTATVLRDVLVQLAQSLTFPKSMRWNAAGFRFARPIRWVLAVYRGRIIPVEIGGVPSGNRTRAHRFVGADRHTRQGIPVRDLKDYVKKLEAKGVVPDQDRRRAMILAQLDTLAGTSKGVLHRDEDLLEQAVFTVEYPQAIVGHFNPSYLSVPKDVLMTAMKEHQGFFSLMHKDGSLLPAFISVTNMKLRDMRLIREGNERVLAARLADAKFFFEEDRKVALAARLSRLQGVTFHQKLGNLEQKSRRVADLADALAHAVGRPEVAAVSRRAGELCKADLVTGLVGEFPTLQGVMGGEYARHDGEPEEVSRAIRDHYLPKAMDGDLPETLVGVLVSLSDRIDTVTAFFHVGVVPTGSEDPLGLRRHALAIVRLIVEGRLRLDLAGAIRRATELLEAQGFRRAGSAQVRDFIADRLRYYARTAHGVRDDVIEAVLVPALADREGALDLADVHERILAVQDVTQRKEFDPLIVGFKRAHRIVDKEQWSRDEVEESLIEHPAERELYDVLRQAQGAIGPAVAARRYADALGILVDMKPTIDAFFTGVMVNAEEPSLRANRLSLLTQVDRLFLSIADFSQITVQGS